VSGARRPRERIEPGPWDVETFDPETHEEPPEDLEAEEPTEEADRP
jgi:hypothetical protein